MGYAMLGSGFVVPTKNSAGEPEISRSDLHFFRKLVLEETDFSKKSLNVFSLCLAIIKPAGCPSEGAASAERS